MMTRQFGLLAVLLAIGIAVAGCGGPSTAEKADAAKTKRQQQERIEQKRLDQHYDIMASAGIARAYVQLARHCLAVLDGRREPNDRRARRSVVALERFAKNYPNAKHAGKSQSMAMLDQSESMESCDPLIADRMLTASVDIALAK